jgi:hypothetical protein
VGQYFGSEAKLISLTLHVLIPKKKELKAGMLFNMIIINNE